MKIIKTPNGIETKVPENIEEDVSLRFSINEISDALKYYHTNGYVILTDIFNISDIDEVNHFWDVEVKSSDKYVYRQATAKAEKHVKNEVGWIMNPILNIQSLNISSFQNFRSAAEKSIFTSKKFVQSTGHFLNDDPRIVQTMYFEGNSETWEHQDTYYLDSDKGHMIGTWIAMEDIEADAGRFFVCVGSHNIELSKQNINDNIVDNHDDYKRRIVEIVRSNSLEMRAPYLRKGEILFWHSRTIHGSLKSNSKSNSRRSITCHVIPSKERFVQLQSRLIKTNSDRIDGIYVYRPKDQAKSHKRLILFLESTFPKSFTFLKNTAIKLTLILNRK